MLEEEKEQEDQLFLFRTYVCQSLWDIDYVLRKAFFNADNDMPQYVELVRREKAPKSEMTAEEIRQRTVELFSR